MTSPFGKQHVYIGFRIEVNLDLILVCLWKKNAPFYFKAEVLNHAASLQHELNANELVQVHIHRIVPEGSADHVWFLTFPNIVPALFPPYPIGPTS